jgi:hypothetical protein
MSDLIQKIAKANDALYKSLSSILADDELEDKQAAVDETFDQYDAYLEKQLARAARASTRPVPRQSLTM